MFVVVVFFFENYSTAFGNYATMSWITNKLYLQDIYLNNLFGTSVGGGNIISDMMI